jgi:hypothetical protein
MFHPERLASVSPHTFMLHREGPKNDTRTHRFASKVSLRSLTMCDLASRYRLISHSLRAHKSGAQTAREFAMCPCVSSSFLIIPLCVFASRSHKPSASEHSAPIAVNANAEEFCTFAAIQPSQHCLPAGWVMTAPTWERVFPLRVIIPL